MLYANVAEMLASNYSSVLELFKYVFPQTGSFSKRAKTNDIQDFVTRFTCRLEDLLIDIPDSVLANPKKEDLEYIANITLAYLNTRLGEKQEIEQEAYDLGEY